MCMVISELEEIDFTSLTSPLNCFQDQGQLFRSETNPENENDGNDEDSIKPEDIPNKMEEDIDSVPMSVVEFLDTIEEPLKDEYLPEAKGKTIYASLLGTAKDLSPVENVQVETGE